MGREGVAFSARLPAAGSPNALGRRLGELRTRGVAYDDLTESNPTRAGFDYGDLLSGLSGRRAYRYDPEPLGAPCARAAVARDCARRGAPVDPAQVVLTASSSEAYGWLFKLLCDPGDRVLVPRPGYPLFEQLSGLEGVRPVAYDLEYHGRWQIDVAGLEAAVTRDTRAVLLVSPNNPTGSFVERTEWEWVRAFCADRSLALIADEVFADYPLQEGATHPTDLAARAEGLTFTLGGLSKSVGLPQLKLGWMVVGGAEAGRALASLELIADTYLSVSAPVALAAAELLEGGVAVRSQILARVRRNLAALRESASRHPAAELLRVDGGWSAVVRVPATRGEEELVLGLLERESVLVHPGYFFDFPREAYLVISLLPPPAVFDAAVARMLGYAAP